MAAPSSGTGSYASLDNDDFAILIAALAPPDQETVRNFFSVALRHATTHGVIVYPNGSDGDPSLWSFDTIIEECQIPHAALNKEGALSQALWVTFLNLMRCYLPASFVFKYPLLQDFLNEYVGKFGVLSAADDQSAAGTGTATVVPSPYYDLLELGRLHQTANWMDVLFRLVPAKKNKGLAIHVVPKLVEGARARYVTGSGQTASTADRVFIYEHEGNIKPYQRGKIGGKKKPAAAAGPGDGAAKPKVPAVRKTKKRQAPVDDGGNPYSYGYATTSSSAMAAAVLSSGNSTMNTRHIRRNYAAFENANALPPGYATAPGPGNSMGGAMNIGVDYGGVHRLAGYGAPMDAALTNNVHYSGAAGTVSMPCQRLAPDTVIVPPGTTVTDTPSSLTVATQEGGLKKSNSTVDIFNFWASQGDVSNEVNEVKGAAAASVRGAKEGTGGVPESKGARGLSVSAGSVAGDGGSGSKYGRGGSSSNNNGNSDEKRGGRRKARRLNQDGASTSSHLTGPDFEDCMTLLSSSSTASLTSLVDNLIENMPPDDDVVQSQASGNKGSRSGRSSRGSRSSEGSENGPMSSPGSSPRSHGVGSSYATGRGVDLEAEEGEEEDADIEAPVQEVVGVSEDNFRGEAGHSAMIQPCMPHSASTDSLSIPSVSTTEGLAKKAENLRSMAGSSVSLLSSTNSMLALLERAISNDSLGWPGSISRPNSANELATHVASAASSSSSNSASGTGSSSGTDGATSAALGCISPQTTSSDGDKKLSSPLISSPANISPRTPVNGRSDGQTAVLPHAGVVGAVIQNGASTHGSPKALLGPPLSRGSNGSQSQPRDCQSNSDGNDSSDDIGLNIVRNDSGTSVATDGSQDGAAAIGGSTTALNRNYSWGGMGGRREGAETVRLSAGGTQGVKNSVVGVAEMPGAMSTGAEGGGEEDEEQSCHNSISSNLPGFPGTHNGHGSCLNGLGKVAGRSSGALGGSSSRSESLDDLKDLVNGSK